MASPIVTMLDMADLQSMMATTFESGCALEVRGPPGCGKTDSALAYAYSRGPQYGLFELNAALANQPDVTGYLFPGKERFIDIDGTEREITIGNYSYPYFMRDKLTGRPAACFSEGMLLIEEYGQGSSDVKRSLAGPIWDHRIGQHLFPKKTDVLILSNRADDRSGVTKDFDFLINRRLITNLKATVDAWLTWAHAHAVSIEMMAYIRHKFGAGEFISQAPKEQGPWMTPRSATFGDKWFHKALAAGHEIDGAVIRAGLGGAIGDGDAHQFIAFTKIRAELPKWEEILKEPSKAKLPKEKDRLMFLAFFLAAKVDKKSIGPVVQYMERMPSDFAVAFYKSCMQRDKALRSTKEFGDWAVKNVALLSAVNS